MKIIVKFLHACKYVYPVVDKIRRTFNAEKTHVHMSPSRALQHQKYLSRCRGRLCTNRKSRVAWHNMFHQIHSEDEIT